LVTTGFEEAVERTAARYERAEGRRTTFYYVRSKLRSDPSAHAVAARAPLGEILDLGCGRGQLAVLLLEAGLATKVRGIDWDAAKIGIAERAAEGLPASFSTGDVRSGGEAPADTVLLVDVLHYLHADEQDALLVRAADLVKPGGRLLVRESSRGHGLRSTITAFAEWVGTTVRMNHGERLVFRDVARELVPVLEDKGLACSVAPCWQGTPLSNVLLEARRT
jgi:2-polyprenyl-3-methyl-5-hydroxy-6-metoxy-1,4-benzoquinol methylase